MTGQLTKIAKNEKIDIDEESINIIAEYGQGSFRDSIGLLDQVSSLEGKITAQKMEVLLGMAPSKLIDNIISAIKKTRPARVYLGLLTLFMTMATISRSFANS